MSRRLVKFFLVLGIIQFIFVLAVFVGMTVTGKGDFKARAVLGMGLGLMIFWEIIIGSLMYRYRDRIKALIDRISLGWKTKFIIFGILLAMLEEVITVTMTNLAPLFGLKVGEAFITASANYWDVVLSHSVIIFVPWFFVWAWLLSKYDFKPAQVFLIFGLTGTLAEAGYGGPQQFLGIGMWMFVYGLMIYLPAYSVPLAEVRGAKPPPWYIYIFIIPLTFASIVLVGPIAALIKYIRPPHFFPGVK